MRHWCLHVVFTVCVLGARLPRSLREEAEVLAQTPPPQSSVDAASAHVLISAVMSAEPKPAQLVVPQRRPPGVCQGLPQGSLHLCTYINEM